MAYVKIPSAPGVFKDDTSLAAEGFWIDANYIRFVRDRWQTRAGYEKASSTPFLGICRGMHSWRDNVGTSYTALGTHTNCYAFNDGSLYDISPVISRGTASVSFTTTNGSTTVTADWTSHGMSVGQSFSFSASSVSAVGGVTIVNAAASITNASTQYIVVTAPTANQITFVAAQTATSNAGPTASTVDYKIYLAPGLADSLGGSGYGAGAYGSGGYGGSNAGTLYARTWSADNWSQNLLMSPRGGALYEWSPTLSATELVTNGDMSSGTGWTQGIGWLIGAGTATATAGTGSDLSTVVTPTQSAWFVLTFDLTRSAGTLTPYIGSTAIGSAISATGRYTRVFYTGTSPLKFTKDATFAGTVDNVSLTQLTNLQVVTNAPTQNTCMLVTPEFICMVLGTTERVSGNFNALHIRTSDQFGNPANTGVPLQTWTPSSSNQSTEIWLAKGSRIVGALNTPYGVAVFTDTALYIGRYVPDPNIVYRFDLVAEGCGLLGPNAACMNGPALVWMSNSKQWFRFMGGSIEPLACTCQRDVFDNLALVQQDKVYASSIAAPTNEAQWLYPDARDNGGQGTECSRYIKFNPVGNSIPCWDPGSINRTAWIDAGIQDYPLATSTSLNATTGVYSGYLYFMEKGDSFDGSAMTWSLTQGAFDIGNGNTLFQVNRMIPDFDDMMGNISLSVRTYRYPNAVPDLNGPYTVTATGQTVDFINVGRQADILYSGNAAPCFARQGAPRFDIEDTGMQF